MNIHEHSTEFPGMPRVVLFLLADVDESDGEPISVVGVVAAAAPQPVTVEVLGTGAPTAATVRQLSLATRSTDGVDDSGCRYCVNECALSATCMGVGKENGFAGGD